MLFIQTAIEGDARDRIADVARVCGRVPDRAVWELPDWETANATIASGDHIVAAYNGVWSLLHGGWDADLDLYFRPELGAALARALGTRVVSGYGYSVIHSWGLRIHTPAGSRSFVVDQDHVAERADGPPFVEGRADEPPFDLFRTRDTLWDLGIYTPPEVDHRFAAVHLAPRV